MDLLDGDGEIANADSAGVVDGVGNRGGCADDADLTGALGAHGIQLVILLLDSVCFESVDVGVRGELVGGEVVVGEVAESCVHFQLFVQRHGHAHGHPAEQL